MEVFEFIWFEEFVWEKDRRGKERKRKRTRKIIENSFMGHRLGRGEGLRKVDN
jgi:hypothetical protein